MCASVRASVCRADGGERVYVCARAKVCTLRVVRVNKRSAAGTHVALLSELREKTNCFFTRV